MGRPAKPLFGTDGIRGMTNRDPMTPDVIQAIGNATAHVMMQTPHRRHVAVIGKDTRLSGYMIESALVSGLVSAGMDVMLVGPLPTPAIAMLVRSLRADAGLMISASHNLYQDNGIKIFGPDGCKITPRQEQAITAAVRASSGASLADPDHIGHVRRIDDAPGRYIEFVKGTFPTAFSLDGLKIVVDCAHGALYRTGPTVFRELGADVVPIHCLPDGRNINRSCGATSPASLQRHVLIHDADLGIAFDGDGDRVVLCDKNGMLFDGDHILALLAQDAMDRNTLKGRGIVGTVMSNMAMEFFLKERSIRLVRTPVGDKYVAEAMRREGMNIGGESSGHIILGDYTFSGDGVLAALQVLAYMQRRRLPLDQCRLFDSWPQALCNAPVTRKESVQHPEFQEHVRQIEAKLLGHGRILVRPSGTEPVIRIMIEAPESPEALQSWAEDLGRTLERVAAEKPRKTTKAGA